jgi:hypothetical protein
MKQRLDARTEATFELLAVSTSKLTGGHAVVSTTYPDGRVEKTKMRLGDKYVLRVSMHFDGEDLQNVQSLRFEHTSEPAKEVPA